MASVPGIAPALVIRHNDDEVRLIVGRGRDQKTEQGKCSKV
jgi:hypothetical protein